MVNKILFIFLLSTNFLYSQIIYDKNEIVINSIELKEYISLYNNYYSEEITDNQALKKLILQKKVISSLYFNNPKFMEILDNNLKKNFNTSDLQNLTKMDFYRFLTIRNEFITEYFVNEFSFEDLELIINSLEDLKLPISSNKCLTIDKLQDLKSNNFFISNFFENIKQNTKNFKVKLNNKSYDVCINEKSFKFIENKIINFINGKTQENFNNFVYGKKY